MRYDLYDIPEGLPDAPLESSRDFTVDRNNWQPRAGVVWTLDEAGRTVLRANTGLMYDQPLLAAYETALLQDGSAARTTVTLTPTSAGAPAFPNTLENTPPGFVRPIGDAATVDPAFRIARSWQTNVQVERALDDWYTVAAGFSYVRGNDLPVITNINLINPTGTLGDGRPIFSTAVSAATRLDPRFRNIQSVQSVGESTYRALTLQLTRRFSDGVQMDFAYTLAKSEDNAPITNVLSVQGDQGRVDPTSLDRDLGPNILDQRHTLRRQHGRAAHRGGLEQGAAGDPQPQPDRRRAALRERRAGQHPRQPRVEQRRKLQQRPAARRAAELAGPAGPVQRGPPLLADRPDSRAAFAPR